MFDDYWNEFISRPKIKELYKESDRLLAKAFYNYGIYDALNAVKELQKSDESLVDYPNQIA